MAELPVEVVARLLAEAGLVGPAFDPVAVAEALDAAARSAASLDELLAEPTTAPIPFDPQWR